MKKIAILCRTEGLSFLEIILSQFAGPDLGLHVDRACVLCWWICYMKGLVGRRLLGPFKTESYGVGIVSNY